MMSSTPDRTTTRAATRRAAIVGAALEVVRERGMAAASVRAVAERAGLGASTMRYYFPSQAALNEAIAAELLGGGLSDLHMADGGLPPGERLLECLVQFLPPEGAGPHELRAVLQQWLTLQHAGLTGPDDALARATLASLTSESLRRVRGWLTSLASEGHLDGEVVEREAVALTSRVDGVCLALLSDAVDLDRVGAVALVRRDVEVLLAASR